MRDETKGDKVRRTMFVKTHPKWSIQKGSSNGNVENTDKDTFILNK